MMGIAENLQLLGPFFAIVWIVTILCTILRPQRYFNSLLLMFRARHRLLLFLT